MSHGWTVTKTVDKLPKFNRPVLVEGLPGIGNVGKVVADFLIDELDAKKIYDFFSYSLPNSAYVTEENLVELPKLEIYHKRCNGRDILLLTGDIQPLDEVSCYEFCDAVIDLFKGIGGTDIITLGGIGLAAPPRNPKVYATANNRKIISRYSKKVALNNRIYGVVGPIVGVSGILLGLGARRGVDAMSLLAETYGHPMYLGIKGSRRMLKILAKALDLEVDMKQLDREIKSMENDILQRTSELADVSSEAAVQKITDKLRSDMRYIG